MATLRVAKQVKSTQRSRKSWQQFGALGMALLLLPGSIAPATAEANQPTLHTACQGAEVLQSTDPDLQWLRSFIQRYRISLVNSIGTSMQAISRYEFLIALNEVVQQVRQAPEGQLHLTSPDLTRLHQLQEKFALETQALSPYRRISRGVPTKRAGAANRVNSGAAIPQAQSALPPAVSSPVAPAPSLSNIPAAPHPPGLSNPAESSAEIFRDRDRRHPPGTFNTEDYQLISENPFLRPSNHPLSTFSIDVDTASYSNVRRFLSQGQLPPKDAVRIEELINYFPYDYPQPAGNQPFSLTTEVAAAPWNARHKLVQIGLKGKQLQTLQPSNLVFLVDVSGSMAQPNKLPLVKQSLCLLVNQLSAQDRVTLVVYAGNAGLVLPPTSGNQKAKILEAIDHLEAGGSTAGGAGIELAYKMAQRSFLPQGNNRVILATDGDFNVGVSSDAELVRLIEQKRDRGIFLTVLGFGTGNYKDAKMEQLADKGNGNYAYIDTLPEAKKVLVQDLRATLFTIAKDVKIQVEFNPAKVQAYRLIGYENRLLRDQDFNDDRKDAGEMGAGHTVTALYEIIPTGIESDVKLPAIDPLKYQQPRATGDSTSNELMQVKLRYKEPTGSTSQLITQPILDQTIAANAASANLKFSSAVALFGMLLRNSEFKGQASFDTVLQLARQAQGKDPEGYRSEFVRLVQRSQQLTVQKPAEERTDGLQLQQ